MDSKARPQITVQAAAPADLWRRTAPLPYTSDPWQLFFSDLALVLLNFWTLPFIVFPLGPCNSGPLDELYPSFANLFDITVHLLLSIAQLAFLVSLPFCLVFFLPFTVVLLYVVGFVSANYLLCRVLLNGRNPTLESKVDLSPFLDKHEDERWIFINGVAAGSQWLQSNIDRIALSFGRKVLGIHNPTTGIIFDVIECLIQRDFSYVTQDIRRGFTEVKAALSDPRCRKVVLILHSQGGIEGGLILDWLFAETPGELLEKMEVYTFGNAANHWNNPLHTVGGKSFVNVGADKASEGSRGRTIAHIEHYANHFDFVSRWGVLEFASEFSKQGRDNRFAGTCFEQYAKGHQFNQHYMDTMFPLDRKRGYGVLDHNKFMDAEVRITGTTEEDEKWSRSKADVDGDIDFVPQVLIRNLTSAIMDSGSASLLSPVTHRSSRKVNQYSRLWQYRNGRTPKD